MELKDYLHLYLGSNLQVEYGYKGAKKIGILAGYDEVYGWQIFRPDVVLAPYVTVRVELIKPILRPLRSLTEEEKIAIYLNEFPERQSGELVRNASDSSWFIVKDEFGRRLTISLFSFKPNTFLKLISKHFDVFGLIEAGLAIDATTLKESVI